jgi:hypothetical protein
VDGKDKMAEFKLGGDIARGFDRCRRPRCNRDGGSGQ